MTNSCTPCLQLVFDKINLELGLVVGISTLCVVQPRPEAFSNTDIQPEQRCRLSSFHLTFIPLVDALGGEPRQKHLVSEGWRMEAGEAQKGIRHPWNIRSVFWLQTSQNVRVGGRLPELSAGDAQEDAKTRRKDVSLEPDKWA